MGWDEPEDAMPWVGLYCAVASLICTLAMAADVAHGFWQWKLWSPNKIFVLNATTITLIGIAMKLPVDLTSRTPNISHDYNIGAIESTKLTSIVFLVTMLANFLPSLGLMNDNELLMNIVALGILVSTIITNIFIQTLTHTLLDIINFSLVIFLLLGPFSIALTVSTSRKILEQRYKESQQLVQSHPLKRFSSKDLKRYLKKFWIMTETSDPQFVIACSPVSCAFGVICVYFAFRGILLGILVNDFWYSPQQVYRWSLKIIFLFQSIGTAVGSIAPMFRCFSSISHYRLSKKWSKNNLNVFRVEKHWIQILQQWKYRHIRSHIPGRHGKIVFHYAKNTFLNVCISLHIVVLVLCKITCLIPRTFLILLSCCWYIVKSLSKKFKKVVQENSIEEEYTRYVVQIEDEAKLSERILRNSLNSITRLLDEFEKKEPKNLMKLLEKSRGFNGVVEFDNDQVPPLCVEEIHSCWNLVLVTLTATAMALPNIANSHFNGLLLGMKEGLEIVRHIEECLDIDGDSVEARKTARLVWIEVEVHRTWLQFDLQKKARKGKPSKEILQWLGDEAAKVVIQCRSSKNPSIDDSTYKFILASSMYRISQTILLHYNEQENGSNDEELFEWISSIIADVLLACFTNLPCVIEMKCHHHEIEKRGDNIRVAAQLLGKSKKILKILKARQPFNIDQDSMAYIDKWRAILKSQTPIGSHITTSIASSTMIQGDSSKGNDMVIVTVM